MRVFAKGRSKVQNVDVQTKRTNEKCEKWKPIVVPIYLVLEQYQRTSAVETKANWLGTGLNLPWGADPYLPPRPDHDYTDYLNADSSLFTLAVPCSKEAQGIIAILAFHNYPTVGWIEGFCYVIGTLFDKATIRPTFFLPTPPFPVYTGL